MPQHAVTPSSPDPWADLATVAAPAAGADVDPWADLATPVATRTGPPPGTTPGSLLRAAGRGLWDSTVGGVVNLVTEVNKDLRTPTGALLGPSLSPLHTLAKGVMGGAKAQAAKAQEAYQAGRYSEALGHGAATVLPVVGPVAADIGERIGTGDPEQIAYAGGTLAGLVAPVAVAKVLPRVGIPALAPNRNAALRAAVAYGEREGIPLGASTATGNRFVRAIQQTTDESLGGAQIAERAAEAQRAAFSRVGDTLATRTSPGPSVTMERAGLTTRDALHRAGQTQATAARGAYGRYAAAEADPANVRSVQVRVDVDPATGVATPVMADVPVPVDMRPYKAALRPIVEKIRAGYSKAEQDAHPTLPTMEQLVHGPDAVPASVAEEMLGVLKHEARGADAPWAKSRSQGLAGKEVRALQAEIDTAVRDVAGPDALRALQEGRAYTRAKYHVKALLFGKRGVSPKLPEEGVDVARQLTADADTRVAQLRRIIQVDPGQAPLLGRAALEEILAKGREGGGWSREAGMFRDWENLGDGTKAVLFRDAALRADLDRFFLLAREAAKLENTSRTAVVTQAVHGATGAMSLMVANPALGMAYLLTPAVISKLLRTKPGIRLLTDGMTVPARGPAGATIAAGLLAQAGDEAEPVTPAPPGLSITAVNDQPVAPIPVTAAAPVLTDASLQQMAAVSGKSLTEVRAEARRRGYTVP